MLRYWKTIPVPSLVQHNLKFFMVHPIIGKFRRQKKVLF